MPTLTAREAESSLLGAMMMDEDALAFGLEHLSSDDLYYLKHKEVLLAIQKARDTGAVDVVTTKDNMNLSAVSYDELGEIIATVPNTRNYKEYFRAVYESARKRELQPVLQEVGDHLSNGTSLSDIRETLLTSCQQLKPITTEVDAGTAAVEQMELLRKEGISMSWGASALDDMLGGLRPSYLYVVGGKTSQGKTTMAINVVYDALEKGKKIVYNVFENVEQVYMRLASLRSGIPFSAFTKPYTLTSDEYEKTKNALVGCQSAYREQLSILPGVPVGDMREEKCDLMVLDYIQNYILDHGISGDEVYEIGRVLAGLRRIAREEGRAAIALSQFNRRQEEMTRRKPRLADLKGSGEIENLCDAALLIWWQWKDGNDRVDERAYDIVVEKNKIGECGDVRLKINVGADSDGTLAIGDYNV